MKSSWIAALGNRLGGLSQDTGLKGKLLKGGIGSIGLKVSSTFLTLLTAVVVARTLGPEQYGIYAYVMALVSLLSLPALFGLPPLVVRETAKAHAHEQWGVMRGIWHWSSSLTTVLTLVIAVGALVAVWLLGDRFSELQIKTMFWGVLLVPLMTLGKLRGAALRGLQEVVQGQLPEMVVKPLLFIAFIGVLAWQQVVLSASLVMAMQVLATLLAFIVGAWLLLQARPEGVRENPAVVMRGKTWIKSAIPLALTSALQMVNKNVDIIMIGWYASSSDVGIYRVAVQGGLLVVFGLQSMNMVIGPYFARFYAKHEKDRLQKLATTSARVILLMTLPVVLLFMFWGEQVVAMVFGDEFVGAAMPLAIISVGQLMNAGFGSVGLVLGMTGYERETTKGVAVATVANVLLNMFLIPVYGINGAAFATAITLFVWNVLLWIAVARHVGVDTFAVPVAKRLRIGNKW